MRHFFDTNILVYLFDASNNRKRMRARDLLNDSVSDGSALLSTQVLQEFFVAVTRKLSVPLRHDDAERAVRDLSKMPTVDVDVVMVLEAIASMRRFNISFWDSLIVQAALRGGATVLYSEDFQHGQNIETITVENPFLAVSA